MKKQRPDNTNPQGKTATAGQAAPAPAATPPLTPTATGIVAALGITLTAFLLLYTFGRALPDALARQRTGRLNRIRAVCEEPLHSEPASPTLGVLPADAPDFTLPDYAGRSLSLSSLRGQVVLVNFWATWCPTCKVEMPSMEQLAAAERGKPFSLLAVSVDEEWAPVRKFFEGGSKLTVLLDKDKSVPPRYGTEKFPETFVVDKDGKVLFYVISDRDWNTPGIKACLAAMMD